MSPPAVTTLPDKAGAVELRALLQDFCAQPDGRGEGLTTGELEHACRTRHGDAFGRVVYAALAALIACGSAPRRGTRRCQITEQLQPVWFAHNARS